MLSLALIAVVTIVVISAWQFSGGSSPPAPRRRTHDGRPGDAAAAPPGRLPAHRSARGGSYVEVHRGGPRGRILFQGTIEKGAIEPFTGNYFWLNVSSPENLAIIVGGKRVALAGNRPEALTVTPGGVHAD